VCKAADRGAGAVIEIGCAAPRRRGITDVVPYRTAAIDACPRCQAPMAAAGGLDPRPCSSGCGEWVPAELVATLWGDIIYRPTTATRWWRDDARGIGCPACRQPMKPVAHDGWRVFRCQHHGAWLEPGVRARIERHFATEIELHQRVREMTAAVRGGDEAAIADLIRRLLALEQQVALLKRLLRD
jgi:hypothetical protein